MGVSLAGTSEAEERSPGGALFPTVLSTSFGSPDRIGADGLCDLDSACEVRIIDFGGKLLDVCIWVLTGLFSA